MATLTVPIADISTNALPGAAVLARLCDLNGQPLRGFTVSGGFLVEPELQTSDASGIATFNLVPNDAIQQDNTYYSIKVAHYPAVIIEKTASTQTLSEAIISSPSALGPAATLNSLGDVDTTGVINGNGLRFINGVWIPAVWPTGGGGGSDKEWATLSSNTTLTPVDASVRHKVDASGGPITITLPSAVGLMPTEFTLKRVNSGANVVTVSCPSGIDGSSTYILDMQWESVTVSSDNAQWMVI